MPIIKFGEKLRTPYLERFSPQDNIEYRLAILEFDPIIGVIFHYLDENDYKGSFQCIQGVCCEVNGVPQMRYFLPVWVYKGLNTYEGELKVLQITKYQYENFSKLAGDFDLRSVDWKVMTQRKGRGKDTSIQAIPGNMWLASAPEDYLAQVSESLQVYFAMAEQTLIRPMNEEDWYKCIRDIGIDIVSLRNSRQPMIAPTGQNKQITGNVPLFKGNVSQIKSNVSGNILHNISQQNSNQNTQKVSPLDKFKKQSPLGQDQSHIVTIPLNSSNVPEDNRIAEQINQDELNAMLPETGNISGEKSKK